MFKLINSTNADNSKKYYMEKLVAEGYIQYSMILYLKYKNK